MDFRAGEQHVDLAFEHYRIVDAGRAVHLAFRARREVDDAEDAALARRRDADLARRTVGAARQICRRFVAHPQERRYQTRSRPDLDVGRRPVVQDDSLSTSMPGDDSPGHSGLTPAARSAPPYLS